MADCLQQQPQGRPTQLMIILSEYELVGNPVTKIFYVRSLGPFCCPICHSNTRIVEGSRKRKLIRNTGTTDTLRISRLRCKSCAKIHHELLSEVVPYKRHEAESIEAVLERKKLLDTPADNYTLERWWKWFAGLAGHLLGVLVSAHLKNSRKIVSLTGNTLQRILQLVGSAPGWLSRVVQTAIKNNCWVQTRSAFHTG